MRPRRTLLSALLGMSALMTAMAATPEVPKQRAQQNTLVRLIQSVIQLVTPAAELPSVSISPQRSSPQAVLPLTALAATPLGPSLWMVTSPNIPPALPRRPQRTLLRC
jgi:hypothetical protein